MSDPSLSIVVPVYNEEARLATTFAALDRFASHSTHAALEIIFVNDGSTDRTEDMIHQFSTSCSVQCISYSPNAGKGAAVRRGMLAVRHAYGLMIDADMSTSLDEIQKFLPYLREGRPVVIGTRKDLTAHVLRHQTFARQKLGEVFTFLAQCITGVAVTDFTCGFKFFSRSAIQDIFPKASIDRWSYDAEILFLAQRAGLSITEVGVQWTNDDRTRVRLWRDASRSLIDLFRIRFNR